MIIYHSVFLCIRFFVVVVVFVIQCRFLLDPLSVIRQLNWFLKK